MPRTKSLRIAIIGAGRVGSALAHLFRKNGHSIDSVVSRTTKSARRLARAVRSRQSSSTVSDLPQSVDCIVLATPDEAIGAVVTQLSALPDLSFKGLTVFHTSGSLTSDLLIPLEQKGATVFALHPVQTFPKRVSAVSQIPDMTGIWYGYEGSMKARPVARRIVRELGGKIVFVPKEEKILYHLACVFASNYPVVILAAAESIVQEAGLRSLEPFEKLIEASVRNAQKLGPAAALTGPLVRGSETILRRHLDELGKKRPDLLPLYKALGLFGLGIAARQGALSDDDVNRLRGVFLKEP
ncbi:MAG: DUF2520 domain-containing protein [Ignavibacteriales bacterium]|nr:DUF2520 domain-containing protein [Ignavibacteriales bacterium]